MHAFGFGYSLRMSAKEPTIGDVFQILQVMQGDIAELKKDVSLLKTDVSVIKVDVSALKADVSALKTDVSILKAHVSILKSDVTTLKDTVIVIHQRLTKIEGDVSINAYQYSRSAKALRGAGKLFTEV